MPAVEVSRLTVRHGRDVVAVDNVSFTADAGEVLVVLGPNGAGKTTTVETLEGYRRPASGAVRVLGLDPVASAGAVRPRIGVMLQDAGVYPGMSPADALRLFASYYDTPLDPGELLERVGLADLRVRRTPWRRLSGGERQRLSLALAIVGRPSVAFLDEPTAGIDPAGRQVVRSIVRSLRDGGACVVLTTHELGEAEQLADRVVILDRGVVVAEGTLASLTAAPTAGGKLSFSARPGLDVGSLAAACGGAGVRERSPGEYVVDRSPTPALVAAVTAWLASAGEAIGELRTGRERLEDVFLRLTGGRTGADGAGGGNGGDDAGGES